MGSGVDVLFLNLPSPPRADVLREFAGGFGVALPSPRAEVGHGPVKQPYLALVYGATIGRQLGLRVGFLDAQADPLDLNGLKRRVAESSPSVVVAPLGLPSVDFDVKSLSIVKEATGATIVAIGTICRVDELNDAVFAGGTVDVAVCGDLEAVAEELFAALLAGHDVTGLAGCTTWEGSVAVKTPGGELEDVDSLPLPAFDLLPMARYRTWEFGRSRSVFGRQYGPLQRYFPLYMSRGCPHCCSYCPYPLGWGKRWRRKAVDHVVREFAALAETGTRNVLLRDQTVSEDIGYIEDVCSALIDHGLELQWLCEARVGSLEPQTLALMRRAGCVRIHYGVETGDTEVFTGEAKRGIDPGVVDRCLAQTKNAGIEPSLHFLVGFEHDSWRSVTSTVNLIRRCHVTSGDCAIMTPYPGTRFYTKMRQEGRLLAGSWADFTGTRPILALQAMSAVELVTARWRILSALEENRSRGVRRRLRDARRALAGDTPCADPSDIIDEAALLSVSDACPLRTRQAAGA